MTISIKHKYVNPKSDTADATVTRASNWNDEHSLTMASGHVLGRATAANGSVEELTAAQARTLIDTAQSGVLAGVNTRTSSYTLVASDRGKIIEMNVASANTVTVPSESGIGGVNYPIGTQIIVTQIGTGQTTLLAAGGVFLKTITAGPATTTRYSSLILYKRASNDWLVADQPYATASASAAAASATSAENSAALAGTRADDVAAIAGFRDFADVTTLLANSTLVYSGTNPNLVVVATEIVRTRTEGFSYKVAASAATDHHVTTAGGVKLYVDGSANGMNVKAFGAKGDGVTDDTANLQKAINAACAAVTQLHWPKGTYLITSSLIANSNTNWRGEGGNSSIIKNNGTVRFMVNDDDTNMTDVTIDGLGFDYNGYNALNFGTAMTFNGLSHTRFRIVNNRVFDSNYPGDNVILQRQGLFLAQNQDVWVLNNNFYHGARIKIGRGGHNVFIQSNKLFYINDNAITMAMDGRIATPNGDFTRNVHIEDNIIINPSGNGIFLGADGEAEDDPAMFVKNVVVSRNIVYLDTPNTSDLLTPRFIQFIAPRGGVSDISITDNVFVMTTNTPSTARECIRFNSPASPVGSFDRVSVTQNKFYTPYKTSTGVYVGVTHNTNDLVISNNEFDGVAEAVWMVNAPTHNRPSITDNVIRNCTRGLRVDGNPVVTNGRFCDNRVVAPDAAIFFASTNAMEWTVQDNQIINSATDAIELRSAGTKNFYIIGNDLRGGTTGPIRLTSSAVLSTSSARYDNLGDAALLEVASAATVTTPYVRAVIVTGTTNIDNITTTGRAGQILTLIFGSALTVNDGTGNLRLVSNFTTTSDDTLTLMCTGNLWVEVARSVT